MDRLRTPFFLLAMIWLHRSDSEDYVAATHCQSIKMSTSPILLRKLADAARRMRHIAQYRQLESPELHLVFPEKLVRVSMGDTKGISGFFCIGDSRKRKCLL